MNSYLSIVTFGATFRGRLHVNSNSCSEISSHIKVDGSDEGRVMNGKISLVPLVPM